MNEIERGWEALRKRCCADPERAKRCVMVSREDFAAAIAAMRGEPVDMCPKCERIGDDCGEHLPTWEELATFWREKCQATDAESNRLRAEVEALREALSFYARENSWKSCGMYMSGRPNPSSAEIDAGNKARAALTRKAPQ